MKAKKIGIIENPALSYLTEPEVPNAPELEERQRKFESPAYAEQKNPPRYVPPRSTEARSKRLQCLIQPSLFSKIKTIAGRRGVSVNDLIHSTLEELAERE
ncbi:MAG: hypothetical protein LBC27_05510 [Spirochaetaceae bacterium]|jgi:predicted HicB family RNase H-like nuclease|nr:hypothetical protein [Spirochaetaceae bacterium]